MALKKFCAHCGCNRLIDCTERYCGVHKKRGMIIHFRMFLMKKKQKRLLILQIS